MAMCSYSNHAYWKSRCKFTPTLQTPGMTVVLVQEVTTWSLSSRVTLHVIPSYLCNISEHLRFELKSSFAVELIGAEVSAWLPQSEADAEGNAQLVDGSGYPALLPFSTTPAQCTTRCTATP